MSDNLNRDLHRVFSEDEYGQTNEVVVLRPEQCELTMDEERVQLALGAAMRRTCSPCEWTWTDEEVLAMAEFVLLSAQKWAAIAQVVNSDLKHLR